jgi:hypothetical protein
MGGGNRIRCKPRNGRIMTLVLLFAARLPAVTEQTPRRRPDVHFPSIPNGLDYGP